MKALIGCTIIIQNDLSTLYLLSKLRLTSIESKVPIWDHLFGSFCEYRSTVYVSLRKTKQIKDRKQNNST